MFPYTLFLPLMDIYTPDFVFCPTLTPPETTSPSFNLNYFTPHPPSNTRHCVLNSIFSSYQLDNSTPYLSSMWDSFKIIDLLCEPHLVIGLNPCTGPISWNLVLPPNSESNKYVKVTSYVYKSWPFPDLLFPNALIGLVLCLSHTWRSLLPFPKSVS